MYYQAKIQSVVCTKFSQRRHNQYIHVDAKPKCFNNNHMMKLLEIDSYTYSHFSLIHVCLL